MHATHLLKTKTPNTLPRTYTAANQQITNGKQATLRLPLFAENACPSPSVQPTPRLTGCQHQLQHVS
ncbi:hypothetical protein ETH_00032655 [Eimeria tenella]|uniref:Uncharacterized protein n=1 Tax=Eimeria tenella TaxID=5802 RepID=U6L4B5_EIMTE|nr:hypothetical protein ETH_00032655 [Eimeria tenella]CDJ44048.1 hypothetical protein ETH_00032655 [Eimeria tenella]|eukprot:XP_013234797.1 hypothetical protein ETH_00032655 [Eimeria tenella]